MSVHSVPRPSRFFLDPAAHDEGGLPAGVCLMQALGVVILTVLAGVPSLAIVIGLLEGRLA